ncbi:MAG: arginine--tRNA ligase [Deltaproteobacteria bacterium]|nr:arginine--tRNA ligase [Deltaproteobacteria bacterium]
MKNRIRKLIIEAALRAYNKGLLPTVEFSDVILEKPKAEAHGDFSTNFAMVIASLQKMAPRNVARVIADQLDDSCRLLEKVEIAGPGFINFYVTPAAWHPVLLEIQKTDRRYGASDLGRGERVQVEFVSSNPTGPLHVGHGRGAAVGDSVANILSFCGYDVQREYYINDSGRQIQTLGRSVYLRYRELLGHDAPFPGDCYQGDYIREIAARIKAQEGDALLHREDGDAALYCARKAAGDIMEGIREDLTLFGITFDKWFSEQSLYDSGKVDRILAESRQRGIVYEKDGALWFKTSDLGDEKDRVVVRQNGQTTYFASDIAYHEDKYRRGFQRVIDVWGADHHGYIARMQAAIEACGHQRNQFDVILVQLVNLLRGGQPVAMSTRTGEFVTLRDVIDEVGKDAARFIFLTRHYESPLDFDLEVAKQQTNENPVYYVQYVHARISSIVRKAVENGMTDLRWDQTAIAQLREPEEIHLIKILAQYPEAVTASAEKLEPHRITFFLMNLAAAFHAYYNKHRVLSEDPLLSRGRLCLAESIRKVVRNGLALLGVDAPEKM